MILHRALVVIATLALLSTSAVAQFVITEFMANNVEGIIDEDGNHEDWIEVFNAGLASASLSGWHLTDNAGQLRKWPFPDKTLAPGQYLIVFASNKDRRNPAANLHTNFKLDAAGEFLAITRAEAGGGTTIVQSWNPYPPQAADVSYGTSQVAAPASFISASAAVKWLVPGSGALGDSWKAEGFNDAAWAGGSAALGLSGAPTVVAAGLQHRYNTTTATLGFDSSGNGRTATNSGAAFLASDADAATAPLKRTGLMQFAGAENDQVSIPANVAYNASAATVCFWMRANLPAGAGNTGAMLWDRRTTTGIVIVQQDDGRLVLQSENNYCLLTGTANVSDSVWHHVAIAMNQAIGQPVTIYVDGQAAGAANNSGTWVWPAAQAIEIGLSHDPYWKRFTGVLDDVRFYNRILTAAEVAQIAAGADTTMGTALFSTSGVDAADITTTLSGMSGANASAFVRIPFTVADPGVFSGVRLGVRFCDGYAAWINGTPVASFNAPATPLWNSAATAPHDPGRTRFTTVAVAASAIHAGTNVLALQVLNHALSEPNVLARPALDALPSATGPAAYLVSATPGATNSAARTALGPHISNTTNNPARPAGGAGSAPLAISTKVVPTLNPIASVQLAYRVMWNAETLVPMTAGALGVYTAQIPTTALGPGQMLRWRVVATDTAASVSTDPLFQNLDGIAGEDTDQYFGTVAAESGYTTQLPVMQWFVQDPAAAATPAGTRCSVFYLDRFYDFVSVNIHGQSTQGFPKKSYNLGFNKDNRFKWALGETEIRSVNLLTNYSDKSKLRNTLAYAAWADARHAASHFSKMLHVRQASGGATAMAFYGIYDLVEDGNEEFIARSGLDGEGALYKMYNSLESAVPPGAEKKTREFEGTADLQALIDGVNPNTRSLAQRRQYIYDHVNVAALVNLCAAHAVMLNTDWGHKNYYVYRDTLGTKEWSALPWDVDLTFGHTWIGSQSYFDDEMHSQAGLPVGGGGNYLMSAVYAVPEFNAMFVRRMRSLMDQSLISATATNGPWDQRVAALIDQIDPPGAAYLTDADRELQTWGWWVDGNATQQFGGVLDAATHTHGARVQAMRILNSNPSPPQTTNASNPELGNTTFAFLPGRRQSLYNGGLTSNGLGVPPAQPASPALTIEQIDFNPASGNQDDEFFVIKNTSGASVDLSGWSIAGAVSFTFPGGTVVPAFTTGFENIGLLHVAKSPAAFRVRTIAPTGGQYRFVTGPYSGALSARGETIELRRPDGTLRTTAAWTPAPTAAQNQLRVTELMYAPAPPSAAELAAIPGVSAGDFEYIELTNLGATPLALAGARFLKGVEFTFPLGATLAAGARVVLASNAAAFQYRHGSAAGGQYLGNLDNAGDTLQLVDSQGEEVLEFHYEPTWYPQSDGTGRSLVTRSAAPGWADYGTPSAPLPTAWALSAPIGGTPGAGDTDFANGYEGWRFGYWSLAELGVIGAPVLPADHADADPLTNFAEYCFGKNPRAADASGLTAATIVNVSGTNYPAIVFTRRHLAADVTWSVEESANLTSWSATCVLVSTQNLGNGLEVVTWRSATAAGTPRFLRVVATK